MRKDERAYELAYCTRIVLSRFFGPDFEQVQYFLNGPRRHRYGSFQHVSLRNTRNIGVDITSAGVSSLGKIMHFFYKFNDE